MYYLGAPFYWARNYDCKKRVTNFDGILDKNKKPYLIINMRSWESQWLENKWLLFKQVKIGVQNNYMRKARAKVFSWIGTQSIND